MIGSPPGISIEGAIDWESLVRGAVAGEVAVDVAFQPVVDLKRGTIVGYEALARFGGPGSIAGGPDTWFAAAHRFGLGADLEARVLRAAFRHRADLPPNCFLAVNLEPEGLASAVVRDALADQGPLGGIVIEITEHRPLDLDALADPLAEVRAAGALIAVDDAGAGYAGLQQILTLRPSIVKLDRTLVMGIDRDEAKAALTEMLGGFANRIDAWVLAEGIETEGEARRLVDLGVPLAQGYYFGRGGPPWVGLDPIAARDLATIADAPAFGLHRLIEVVPAVDELTAFISPGAVGSVAWRPVVDNERRPVGFVTADSALVGGLVEALVANVHSSPSEVAHRVSTAVAEPQAPVMVVDNAGRFLGIVPLRRILAHLGHDDDPDS